MKRQRRRLYQWLELRGWRRTLNSRWVHEILSPHKGLTSESAMRRQIRSDLNGAVSSRNTEITRVDKAMDEEWRRDVFAAIRDVAESQRELTTDDVLDTNEHLEKGRDKRALGPMMLHAAKEGLIEPTDYYAPSTRRASNARHKRVWRSLVHDGQEPDPQRTAGLDVLKAVP